MPYHIAKSDSCPVSKPWGVMKTADGKIMGCHPSHGAALQQMQALYANERSVMANREPIQVRSLTFDLASREAGSEGIPIVVSTDAVVEVDDGPEILVHEPDAIDLRRAPLPILAGHNSDRISFGIVDKLAVRDGRLRGIATFGSRPEAAGYKDDVLNQIIRSVSIRYARIRAKVRSDGVLVTSRWMPTHVAMVAEPADIGAGFYRSAPPAFELEVETPQAPAAKPEGVRAMTEEVKPAAIVSAGNGEVKDARTPEQMMADHIKSVKNIAEGVPTEIVNRWINEGTPWNDIGDYMVKFRQMKAEANLKSSPPFLDLEKKDVKRYSLLRAISACAARDWSKAGLELDSHKTLMNRLNRSPRSETSFFVPLDVMLRGSAQYGERLLDTVGSGTGSNYLVSTTNMPGSFIDLLRNTSVALRAGVTRMAGLVGNVTIPKMTAGNTAYWLATDGVTQITESAPTIDQVALAPKNVAARTSLSHQLIQQSTPDAEQLVLTSIARDLALAVDVGIIRGSGNTGQPQGIVGASNVGSVTGTSLAAAGIIEFQTDVAAANALMPGCAYVTTPAVAGDLMVTPEIATVGTNRVWQGSLLEGTMFGFPAYASNQMSSATMLFGHWPSVILAEWGVLELMTNPFSDFTRGLVEVRGWYTCDVGLRYPAAFSYASSIT